MFSISIILALCVSVTPILGGVVRQTTRATCEEILPLELRDEIKSYAPTVQLILSTLIDGDYRDVTYTELAYFADKFGNRLAGTQNLEDAVDYMLDKGRASGLENVHGEEVQTVKWIRGAESAILVEPRNATLSILGLGLTIGTPPEGILADVVVVKSFDELDRISTRVAGKIVVFNEEYISYGATVSYRGNGASAASRYGAVATLIRSITPYSINSPHTGAQTYADDVNPIPSASITIEDARMLQRMQDRGQPIKILLKLEAQTLPDLVTARNTVMELQGSLNPQKIVVLSGHLDSWDVGSGVMDDAGGAFISWSALALLKRLNLRPRRTIRTILWTAEETDFAGALTYDQDHAEELDDFIFFMESDEGTFKPIGLQYTAGELGGCILGEIVALLAPINTTEISWSSDVGSDISVWLDRGFPGAAPLQENQEYFWYHHSAGDTMDLENADDLNKNTAIWATVAYVLADLSIDFPRSD